MSKRSRKAHGIPRHPGRNTQTSRTTRPSSTRSRRAAFLPSNVAGYLISQAPASDDGIECWALDDSTGHHWGVSRSPSGMWQCQEMHLGPRGLIVDPSLHGLVRGLGRSCTCTDCLTQGYSATPDLECSHIAAVRALVATAGVR